MKAVWEQYRIPILLGSVSLFFIILSITLLFKSYQPASPIQFSQNEATVAGVMNELVIDIAGAVVKPGVYRLPAGSRVDDAIIAAGGLSDDVNNELVASGINRAAKLIDGAKLYIPKKGEISSRVAGLASVSINSASQAQLEGLSGIGPATAKKIIDLRPYMSLEELVSKKTISQSLFEKLKNDLTL